MNGGHVEELLALYALGGLEPDEQAHVDAHLADCAACRAEAERQQALTAAIGLAVPEHEPDPAVRGRLLQRLAASPLPDRGPDARAAQPARPRPQPRPAPWTTRLRQTLRRLAPAALTLALAALAAWNLYLTDQLNGLRGQLRGYQAAMALISSPNTDEIHLAAQASSVAASGRAYIDERTGSVVLVVEHLAPVEGRAYQAWIITDEGPVNAGLVNVSRVGWGMTWLDVPYTPTAAIGVSLEPEGGSDAPSEVILLGGM